MSKTFQNKVSIFRPDCEQSPKHPISLLEIMREFIAFNVFDWYFRLEEWHKKTAVPRQEPLTAKEIGELCGFVTGFMGKAMYEMDWGNADYRRDALFSLLIRKTPPSAESVNTAIRELQLAIAAELDERVFVMVEKGKVHFFNQETLFGKHVLESFPSARNEIKDAVNCLAVDLNTAAVFHLIRSAEIGMRELAAKLKVVVHRQKEKISIADATWDELIRGIKTRIESEKLKPKRNRRFIKGNFRHYKILIDHLNILKDTRNHVMHTRADYSFPEAFGICGRVKEFFKKLCEK